MVGTLEATYQVSERRACRAMGFNRASHRYQSVADPQVALRMRLREVAASRVGWGYRRLHILGSGDTILIFLTGGRVRG